MFTNLLEEADCANKTYSNAGLEFGNFNAESASAPARGLGWWRWGKVRHKVYPFAGKPRL